MATQTSPAAFLAGIKEIILSAAATVVATLSLFNTVFAELVPPLQAKAITVGWVSLGALVVLLVLSAVFTVLRGRTLALLACSLLGAVFLSLSFALYLPYAGELRTYVVEVSDKEGKQRFVRGEIHEQGLKRLGSRTVEEFASSDLHGVLHTEMLWTTKSQLAVSARLERSYVEISMAMIAAIFLSALSMGELWQSRPQPQIPRDRAN